MKVAIAKERRTEERRVAASLETVKRMTGMGLEVLIEPGAGDGAAFPDAGYEAAGARIDANAAGDADLVLKVQRPTADELGRLKRGSVLIALLQALQHRDDAEVYARAVLPVRHDAGVAHHARTVDGRAVEPGEPRETAGGYANEMGEDLQRRQRACRRGAEE
jgi:NAD/NADP transhydrogenase alpha subunit